MCAGVMAWIIIQRLLVVASAQTSSKFWLSTGASEGDNDVEKNDGEEDDYDTFSNELQPQGVDPTRGWGYRGVHKVSHPCLQMCFIFKSWDLESCRLGILPNK